MSYAKNIKQAAIHLRQRGLSIIQIARKLHIAKSTTSLWVKDVPLPKAIAAQIKHRELVGREKGLAVMKAKRVLTQRQYEKEALILLQDLRPFKKRDLLRLLCAVVFWCEGSKRRTSTANFTNSDPSLVKFFLFAMRSAFKLDESKFRPLIHLHEYHFVKKQTLFWSKITGIPWQQFTKPYCKPNTRKRIRDGYEGCISIRYHDAKIAKRLSALYHILAKRVP